MDAVTALTTDLQQKTIELQILASLRSQLRGNILTPTDDEYDES